MEQKNIAQILRLAELKNTPHDEIRKLIDDIRHQRNLPKLGRHYAKHRDNLDDIEIKSVSSYVARLRKHLQRPDTRIYTYITTKPTQDRMWVVVSMDNGLVAQYNQTKRRLWSFYRQSVIETYLEAATGWWVEVIISEEGVECKPL